MAGRRVRGRERRLEELVRRAYTTEPLPTVHHPRRTALAPKAAMAAGSALIVLAIVLAVAAVLRSPTPSSLALSAASPSSTPRPGAVGSGAGVGGGNQSSPPFPKPGGPKAGEVTVHVTGAVASPAVVHLPAGSRVADAVAAAGGASAEADTQALNLARVLTDGEQVRVPKVGEPPPVGGGDGASGVGAGGGGDSGGGGGAGASGGKVNVNTADATALETLPGIGPTLAKRIIAYRTEHGPFAAVDDLTDVPGIGPAVLEGLRQEATV